MPVDDSGLGRMTPVWCYRRRWATDTVLGGMLRTSFRLWYIVDGRIDIDTGTSRLRYSGGQWVSAPRSYQQQKLHAGTDLVSLSMEWRLPDGSAPLRRIPDGVLDLGRHDRQLRRLLFAQSRLQGNDGTRPPPRGEDGDHARLALVHAGLWRIAGILLGLYPPPEAQGEAAESPPDARVALALRELRHRSRTRFPEHELERATGVGRRRLEQLFLEKLGVTPRAYHARLRLEEACLLVMQGRMQVKEIARTLGFTSQSAFTQAFIRTHGMSPSAYKARSGT